MIEISCLKDLNAAKLFLGFRIGAVGHRDFAVVASSTAVADCSVTVSGNEARHILI
jgi:hypothetical protein